MNSILANIFCTGGLLALSINPPPQRKEVAVPFLPVNKIENINYPLVTSKTWVLPLTLIYFNTTKTYNNKVELTWKTAQEMNVSHFNIERSADGRKWNRVGIKKATGQQGSVEIYTFTDATPAADANYYRLHVMDFDGAADYSPVRLMVFGDPKPVKVYPSVGYSHSPFYVEGISPEKAVVEIHSNTGRIVQKLKLYSNSFTVPQLHPGTYHVRIINHSNQSVVCRQKIMIR